MEAKLRFRKMISVLSSMNIYSSLSGLFTEIGEMKEPSRIFESSLKVARFHAQKCVPIGLKQEAHGYLILQSFFL